MKACLLWIGPFHSLLLILTPTAVPRTSMHACCSDLKWISLAFEFHVNILEKLNKMVQFNKLLFSIAYVPNTIQIMAILKLKSNKAKQY